MRCERGETAPDFSLLVQCESDEVVQDCSTKSSVELANQQAPFQPAELVNMCAPFLPAELINLAAVSQKMGNVRDKINEIEEVKPKLCD